MATRIDKKIVGYKVGDTEQDGEPPCSDAGSG